MLGRNPIPIEINLKYEFDDATIKLTLKAYNSNLRDWIISYHPRILGLPQGSKSGTLEFATYANAEKFDADVLNIKTPDASITFTTYATKAETAPIQERALRVKALLESINELINVAYQPEFAVFSELFKRIETIYDEELKRRSEAKPSFWAALYPWGSTSSETTEATNKP